MGKFLRNQRGIGFTLIEVIIAVAIFGIIIAMVAPTMIQFIKIRERVIIKHEQIEGLQKTFLFMAKDMRFASNRLGKDEYGEVGDATLSVGDDGLIDFTAMYPDLNLGGLNVPRRVRWVLEEGVLQRVQSPVMDPDGDTRVFKQSFLKGVDKVEIELSSIEDGRDSTSKRWNEETRLPDMISIVIKMDNNIEYQRLFTMLGGDKTEALAAASGQSGQPGQGGQPLNDEQQEQADDQVVEPFVPDADQFLGEDI